MELPCATTAHQRSKANLLGRKRPRRSSNSLRSVCSGLRLTSCPHRCSIVVFYSVCMLSHAQLFAHPWTVACQTPLCMGILQARILEWVAISYSRGSFRPRDQTCVSCIVGRYFTIGPLGKSLSTLLYFLIFFRIFSPSV